MSMFSKGLKKVGHWATSHYDDIGTAAGFVGGALVGQPIAGAALGRSAASMIGPEHAGEKNLRGALRQGAIGAAYGAAGDALGAEHLVPGAQSGNINLGSFGDVMGRMKGRLGGAMRKKGPGDLVDAAAAKRSGTGWGDIARGAVGDAFGWAKDNPAMVLAGLSALQGSRQSQQSDATRALVLKKLGEIDMNQRVNLGGVFGDPGNPYAHAALGN